MSSYRIDHEHGEPENQTANRRCSINSVHGRIVSNWRRRGDQLVTEVTIPANATATVCVPSKDTAEVTESGKTAAQAEGGKLLRLRNDAAVYAVGSGTCRFQSTLPETIG